MPLEGRSPGRRLSTHPQGDLCLLLTGTVRKRSDIRANFKKNGGKNT
jgi:hypothetical protein